MKRLLSLLLVIMLFLIPCSAMALGWEGEVKPTTSQYGLTIEKYAIQHDSYGHSSFYCSPSGTTSTGSPVFFSIKLTVPTQSELLSEYGVDPGSDGACVIIQLSKLNPTTITGVTRTAVDEAALPAATDVNQTLYLSPDGSWRTDVGEALWCGYALTSAPTVTASIKYNYSLSQIVVQNGAESYTVATASDGYVFHGTDSALSFHTDNVGKVIYTTLELGAESHKVYQARTGFGVEGDNNYGLYASIVAKYLLSLGIEADSLFDGSVYMTAENIRNNFGPAVAITGVASWAPQVVIPETPIVEIPQTGDAPAGLPIILFLVGGGALAACIIITKSKRLNKTVV